MKARGKAPRGLALARLAGLIGLLALFAAMGVWVLMIPRIVLLLLLLFSGVKTVANAVKTRPFGAPLKTSALLLTTYLGRWVTPRLVSTVSPFRRFLCSRTTALVPTQVPAQRTPLTHRYG